MDSPKITFGKHKGKSYDEIYVADTGYCRWVLNVENCTGGLYLFQKWLKIKKGIPVEDVPVEVVKPNRKIQKDKCSRCDNTRNLTSIGNSLESICNEKLCEEKKYHWHCDFCKEPITKGTINMNCGHCAAERTARKKTKISNYPKGQIPLVNVNYHGLIDINKTRKRKFYDPKNKEELDLLVAIIPKIENNFCSEKPKYAMLKESWLTKD